MNGSSKNSGKKSVAVLGAAFLLFLLLRMFAQGDEGQIGLAPPRQAERTRQRSLEPSRDLLPDALSVAVTEEPAGPKRQALKTQWSIRGRAVLGDEPLKGVTVLLFSSVCRPTPASASTSLTAKGK